MKPGKSSKIYNKQINRNYNELQTIFNISLLALLEYSVLSDIIKNKKARLVVKNLSFWSWTGWTLPHSANGITEGKWLNFLGFHFLF